MKKCIKTNKKVQILLSTYNGEKYLKEQLNSFLNLEGYENIKVLIRDDGSTDSTLDILYEYKDKYGFEVLKGENLGVNKSLFELFKYCDNTCDYFAISDQDDVWKKNKIVKAIKVLSKYSDEVPLLFSSLSCITDENLNPIGTTIIPNKSPSFYNAVTQNITPGHTQVFNKKLMKLLKYSDNMNVIDWWIYLLASSTGKIIFYKKCTVFHRQHKGNSIGYELNFFKNLFYRTIRYINDKDNKLGNQLCSFYIEYKNIMNRDCRLELEKFLFSQSSVYKRLKYILKSKVYRQSKYETYIFKILYLLGKYKPKKYERYLINESKGYFKR